MEVLIENVIVYSAVILLIAIIVFIYLRKQKVETKRVQEKIRIAKEEGLHEPVSMHPVVDVNKCIRTGACISACPEKDILGISNGKATIINASRCIGHGACFHACPVEAITLCIGTEKRGVDLPHVSQNFESNVPGIFIAGELGGMGLIRNAVEQGRQAVENLSRTIQKNIRADFDLIVVGAGPAGISATLAARKLGLKVLTLEQDTLGGTVYSFPRSKIVMTAPMDLPLHGKVRLFETSKSELLELWGTVLKKNRITITENAKVDTIVAQDGHFMVGTTSGNHYSTRKVLLSIGRRGSPRKLDIPGEDSEKVAYRLLEPELITGKRIVVVGGGDSAIESALLLADANKVTLMYRGEVFGRIKPKNNEKIKQALVIGTIDVRFKTSLSSIEANRVFYTVDEGSETLPLDNDLVFIFAGGELPTQFLEKSGILITRKFGEAILKH